MPDINPDVLVRPIDTIEEFRIHVRITHEVFGMLDRLPEEPKRIESDGARKLASTLQRFRRRGVYSALVRHRWFEAVARATPHLITRAGPMSRPILRKLGFQELAEVHFLLDSPR